MKQTKNECFIRISQLYNLSVLLKYHLPFFQKGPQIESMWCQQVEIGMIAK